MGGIDRQGGAYYLIVSPKGLKNGTIEISARDKSMKEIKPIDEAVDFVVASFSDPENAGKGDETKKQGEIAQTLPKQPCLVP